MATGVLRDAALASARRRLPKSTFFTILGVMLLSFAVAGFWPQYFSAVTGRNPAPSTQFWMIHLHVAFFTGWLLMYIWQAVLIMAGRPRLHFKLGPSLAAFGFVFAAVGIFASLLLAYRLGIRENDFEVAAAFVFFPLIDMVFLPGF